MPSIAPDATPGATEVMSSNGSTAAVDAGVRPSFAFFGGDGEAVALGDELFTKWRSVAELEAAHTMDGGYRGMIRIEPAAPIGANRKHLAWIVAALRDFDAFFAAIDARASAPSPTRYRFAPITVRFFRSVHARTPSAYAHDWIVAWNLDGSLNTSADAARETMFHEVFHLNDYAHPKGPYPAWSLAALSGVFESAVRKCGVRTACLAPYAPNHTLVKGGTYYAFQPGNGVVEYAAELALRFYREQRVALGLTRGSIPRFKCGPPENERAWNAIRDEFFAGVDAVPSCQR